MMPQSRIIFTDGASKGNPGRGGFGVVLTDGTTVTERGAAWANTTNNEMELMAVVEALSHCADKHGPIAIYTDSKYVVEGAQGWVFGWLKNGWKTKANTEVANKELWQKLVPLLSRSDITWHKVPGHVGIVGNERADVIASTFAERGHCDLYSGPISGYALDLSNVAYDEVKKQERSANRQRQSQKAYSYVSKVDGKIVIHQSWADCERLVKGAKGARFKKALSLEDQHKIVSDFSQ